MIAKAEDVKSLLEQNEFLLCAADPFEDEFNAIRNKVLGCASRPRECIEAIQQMHGLCIKSS